MVTRDKLSTCDKMKTHNQYLKDIHAFEIKIFFQKEQKDDTIMVLPTLRLHNRKAGTFKVNESRYIALLVISKFIKSLLNCLCQYLVFSIISFFSIITFSRYFLNIFRPWNYLHRDSLTLNKNVVFVWKYQVNFNIAFNWWTNNFFFGPLKRQGEGCTTLTAKIS